MTLCKSDLTMMEFLLFKGALCVTIRFTPKNTEKIRDVESYFPVMEGNKVTLYQVKRLSHLIISPVQQVMNFMWKCPKSGHNRPVGCFEMSNFRSFQIHL